MAQKPNEKQITFYIDEMERDQFQRLCKTMNLSAANVLRQWVWTAIKEGSIELQGVAQGTTKAVAKTSNFDDQVIKNMLVRLDQIEKQTAYLNENQMEFIKDEVLGDSMGTLRNRIGVVENQLQDLGGNIARK